MSTELDTELGLCTAKMEGEFKESKLEKSPKYYACKSGEWKEISKTAYELKSCTEKRENEYVKAESGEMFVCLGKQWIELDSIAYELKACTESRDGEFAKTKSKDYFHCENKEWVSVTAKDAEANAVCDESSKNVVVKNPKDAYFVCDGESWNNTTAKDYKVGTVCNEKNKDKKVEKGESHYFCNGSEWKDISADEFEHGFCSETENNLKVVDGFACENSKWRKATPEEVFARAVCNKDNASYEYDKWFFNKAKDSAEICYNVCDEYCDEGIPVYEFRYASEEELAVKDVCLYDDLGKMQDGYTCAPLAGGKYAWRKTNAGEKATGKYCEFDNLGEVLEGFVCDESATGSDWRKASDAEQATHFICDSTKKDTVVNGYACVDNEWREASYEEETLKRVCNSAIWDTVYLNFYNTSYICRKSTEEWDYASDEEKKAKGECWSGSKFSVKNGYACDTTLNGGAIKYAWREASPFEIKAGSVCNSSNTMVKTGKSYTYDVGSQTIMFACSDGIFGGRFKDPRTEDNLLVKSIKSDVWLQEVKYKPNDGTSVSVCRNGDSEPCSKGRLYDVQAKSKACPSGWTLPGEDLIGKSVAPYVNGFYDEYVDTYCVQSGKYQTGSYLYESGSGTATGYAYTFWGEGGYTISIVKNETVFKKGKFSSSGSTTATYAFPVRCILEK